MSEKGILLRVMLGIALVFALIIGVWVFRVQTAEIKGKGDAQIQIQSAGSRIQAYNHFFNLCAAVKTSEDSIDVQSALLKTAGSDYEKNRIGIVIGGLQSKRASDINQYNADASKDYTIGQFQDSDLPWQLSSAAYVAGGPKTSCNF